MTSTIEFTLSSPCPAHRDAILSWVVEGSDSPAAAAAAEHVKKCVACREFRDSLKMQRVLVSRGITPAHSTSSREPALVGADLISQIELELRKRSEDAVALDLWRLAEWLFLLDPAAARGTFSENSKNGLGPAFPGAELEELNRKYASAPSETGWPLFGSTRLSAAHKSAKSALSAGSSISEKLRESMIRELVDAGLQLSNRIRSPMLSLLGHFEWFKGNEPLVSDHFSQALEFAVTPSQRAHAIANLALCKSALFEYRDAIQLGEAAIKSCASLAFPRVNLAVWLIIEGRTDESLHQLAQARSSVGSSRLQKVWPWALLQEWLNNGLAGISSSNRERDFASATLWSAYCLAIDQVPRDAKPVSSVFDRRTSSRDDS